MYIGVSIETQQCFIIEQPELYDDNMFTVRKHCTCVPFFLEAEAHVTKKFESRSFFLSDKCSQNAQNVARTTSYLDTTSIFRNAVRTSLY